MIAKLQRAVEELKSNGYLSEQTLAELNQDEQRLVRERAEEAL